MVDGSSDTGLYKMFPITVRVFCVNWSRVMKKCLHINLITGRDNSTAAAMFNSVDEKFQAFKLSWDSVTGIGVNNTNPDIGNSNSIKSRALKKNQNIVMAECPCHVLHNAAGHGSTEFSNITGFDIEDHGDQQKTALSLRE